MSCVAGARTIIVLRPALATLECLRPMSVRFRKLIGAVALFVVVIVWALIAMAVAQFPAIRDNTVLSILYYVIAGCGASAATISSPGMRFR